MRISLILAAHKADAPSWVIGGFCLLGALVVAGQLVFTSRQGFVFCERNEVVYKKDNPTKYGRFAYAHVFLALGLLGIAIWNFLP